MVLGMWDLDFDNRDMTLDNGQHLCEILSRSNLARSYGPDTGFGIHVSTVTLTLEIWSWCKVITHPWVMGNKCEKYYQDPTWQWGVMARTRIFGICVLWPCPRRYDLASRWWHTLGSWTTIVWKIIKIQLGSEELWPEQGFWVCVHCDLDIKDICVMDNINKRLKYNSDPTLQWGVMRPDKDIW